MKINLKVYITFQKFKNGQKHSNKILDGKKLILTFEFPSIVQQIMKTLRIKNSSDFHSPQKFSKRQLKLKLLFQATSNMTYRVVKSKLIHKLNILAEAARKSKNHRSCEIPKLNAGKMN